jgi:hypothetical protein
MYLPEVNDGTPRRVLTGEFDLDAVAGTCFER